MVPSRTMVLPGKCDACTGGTSTIASATTPTTAPMTAMVIQRHIVLPPGGHAIGRRRGRSQASLSFILTCQQGLGYVGLLTDGSSRPCDAVPAVTQSGGPVYCGRSKKGDVR